MPDNRVNVQTQTCPAKTWSHFNYNDGEKDSIDHLGRQAVDEDALAALDPKEREERQNAQQRYDTFSDGITKKLEGLRARVEDLHKKPNSKSKDQS